MKNLYLGLISVIATISCKPVCVIEGNLTGMEGDGWIYMVDAGDDSIVIDSTRYQDGVCRVRSPDICSD